MTDNPASPGSQAMILNHEQFTDQSGLNGFYETQYYRIKIFTEQGKKYADIEIPFVKNGSRITDIVARTIHPDGKIIEFGGQVFERTVVKARGSKVFLKAFTLPEVEPGSIIEYRFHIRWTDPNLAFLEGNHWTLQENLFMRRGSYSLKPYPYLSLRSAGLTYHGEAVHEDHGLMVLEEKNVPPFVQENFMPPEDELTPHFDFYYSLRQIEPADQFWKRVGREHYEAMEKFLGNSKEAAKVVSQTISPADPPATRLRKLYARAQQIKNLSFERPKTENEEKRERLKENKNVEEVLKRGYGRGSETNYVFVALARAAGLDATIAEVATRDLVSFNRNLLNEYQLNGRVAGVRLGSEDVYLDPATPLCPYGLLPWPETASPGLRLEKDGGEFITTPVPKSTDAEVDRRGELQLDADGNLDGKLVVSFKGAEALRLRADEADQDDPGRRKDVEGQIKSWLPAGARLEVTSVTGWVGSEGPLTVESKLSLPNFATTAKLRILLPASIFESELTHAFSASLRVHPVYFAYPFQVVDGISIHLPGGYRVESLPGNVASVPGAAEYQIAAKQQRDGLHVDRSFAIETIRLEPHFYSALRAFISTVKTSDEDQVVLESGNPTTKQ